MEQSPSAIRDAKDHITEIRSKRIVRDNDTRGSNTDVLKRTLDIIAERLYQKSTHFLLELIQNADDNHFKTKSPTLTFKYENRILQVGCNETGFTRENVDAICTAGDSSKIGVNQAGRYIGQKGIGFKSVFKATDVVWIQSGPYSFKFDKTQPLGIITPIWADFPGQVGSLDESAKTQPGYTSFYLKLSDDYNEEELVKDLCSIDSRLLIFLQKLRRINLQVARKDGTIVNKRLEKLDEPTNDSGHCLLKENDQFIDYTVIRHTMALSKSQDHPPSEIVLAFPTSANTDLGSVSQDVYAFLPIQPYGFSFLLQADFALTANREDIDNSNTWNYSIVLDLQNAFVAAIKTIATKMLQYDWPLYIPLDSRSDIFSLFRSAVLTRLKAEKVLQSYSKEFFMSESLLYVSKEYLDSKGKPFTLGEHTQFKYLAPVYNETALPALEKLGVQKLTFDTFLHHLSSLIKDNFEAFRSKDDDWHSELAAVLVPQVNNTTFNARMKELQIVPLRGTKKWVSSNKNTIFFSKNDSNFEVPGGVEMLVVRPEAEADFNRQRLLSGLGVKSFDTANVRQLILDLHADEARISKVSLDDLVSQAKFLYESNWEPAEIANIWFMSENENRRKGSMLYIDANPRNKLSAANLFANRRADAEFLHPQYLLEFPDQSDAWKSWLQKYFGLAQIPRLVSKLPNGSFHLSKDFNFLFHEFASSDILILLRDNWEHYSRWIEEDPKDKAAESIFNQSRRKLIAELGSMPVLCKDGKKHQLKQTSLTDIDPDISASEIGFILDVPVPLRPAWRVLQHLGVSVELNVFFYFQCIQNMMSLEVSELAMNLLYLKIQARIDELDRDLRDFTKTQNFIYIPAQGARKFKWVRAKDCIWNETSRSNSDVFSLAGFYRACKRLFCQVAGVRDNEVDLYISEAKRINDQNKSTDISGLFLKISEVLRWDHTRTTADAVSGLLEDKIFPVKIEEDGSQFHHLSTASDRDNWYIADDIQQYQSFHKKIPLLAFQIDEISQMDNLFDKLGLGHRKLSTRAKRMINATGDIRIHPEYTESLKTKMSYIVRLMPRIVFDREDIYSLLCNTLICQVTTVKQAWSMVADGREIRGRASNTRVAEKIEDGWLFIFMIEKDILAASPPYELVEILARICHIRSLKHTSLLLSTLTLPNESEIRGLFLRQAVPEDRGFVEFMRKRGNRMVQRRPRRDKLFDVDEIPEVAKDPPNPKSSGPQTNGTRTGDQRGVNKKASQTAGENNSQIRWQKIEVPDRKTTFGSANHGSNPDADLQEDINEAGNLGYELQNITDPFDASPQFGEQLGDRVNQQEGNQIPSGQNFQPLSTSNGNSKNSADSKDGPAGEKKPQDSSAVRDGDSQEEGPKWENSVAPPDKFLRRSKFRLLHDTLRRESSDNDQYLGELITSNFLKRRVKSYNPHQHWTSPMRKRAGYSSFKNKDDSHSTFTMSRNSHDVNDLFIHQGYSNAEHWTLDPPQYHLEVTTISGGTDSVFPLSVSQLERARKYRLPDNSKHAPTHVLALIKISNLHSNMDFRIYVDPWQLYLSDTMRLSRGAKLEARILRPSATLRTVSPPRRRKRSLFNCFKPHGQDARDRDDDGSLELDFSNSIQKRDRRRTNSYKYRSLEGTTYMRVLAILPGSAGSELQGVLHHVKLGSAESYMALSYSWGTQKPSKLLKTPEGVIQLTPTLHAALVKLRETERHTMVWVDAICINQSDNKEKVDQIRLMANIFNTAARVAAYLGEEADDSGLALQTLAQIHANVTSPKKWPVGLPVIPQSWGEEYIPPANDAVWKSIIALFARAWFRRVWIIQEAVVAAKITIICGDWTIDWNDLVTAVENCDSEIKSGGEQYQDLHNIFSHFRILVQRRDDMAREETWALLGLLEFFRYAEATRQRDRLFALLNLAADKDEQQGFKPDYDCAFEDIVLRYGRAFVAQGRTLAMLYHAGLSSKRDLKPGEDPDRFPSWIPDWTILRQKGLVESFKRGVPRAPRVKLALRARFEAGIDNELVIGALHADEVAHVSVEANVPSRARQYLQEISSTIDHHEGKYFPRERKSELKWRVPIANAQFPEITHSGLGRLKSSYRALMDLYEGKITTGTTSTSSRYVDAVGDKSADAANSIIDDSVLQSQEGKSQDYLNTLHGCFHEWRFIVTKRGYVGIASRLVQVGDVVSLFGGSEVLFLLRKGEHGAPWHSLIGDCYIHGISSEYFDDVEEEDVRLR